MEAARILEALKKLGGDVLTVTSTMATESGDKATADADLADVETTQDWASIAQLPEWKQLCIKTYYACRDKGWMGKCDSCLRRCEGQREWPSSMCRPRPRAR
jgi:hypothetical protein